MPPKDLHANIEKLNIVPKFSWKISATDDSTNDLDPTNALKIRKPMSGKKKPGRNVIEWSNPYGDHNAHFIHYIEIPNAENSYYNHKKIRNYIWCKT